jgi:uncharacterized protein YndB with AHSA1/START domain
MAAKTTVLAEPGKPTIVITREFDAPRRLVFEASTTPDLLRKWWGRHGTTLSVCEVDLRPGGAWRFVLKDPGGGEWPFRGVYREIAAPERLVYTFVFDVPDIRDRPALVTTRFEERGGKTTMTETIVHQTVADRDGHLASGMEEGTTETFERLDAVLRALSR